MFKTLRTPTVFCLLTIVIFGWLQSWTTHRSATDYHGITRLVHSQSDSRDYRPFYFLAHKISVIRGNYTYASTISDSRSYTWAVIQTSEGTRVVRTKNLPDIIESEAILRTSVSDERLDFYHYGLLAPVLTKQHNYIKSIPYAGFPPLSIKEMCDAYNSHEPEKFGPMNPVPRLKWTLSYRALFHDLFFLITLIAYLISLAAIPHWPIWKRITPA